MMPQIRERLQKLYADLVKAQWDGAFEPDVESALWTVKRALAGEGESFVAMEYAINTLRQIGVYETPKVSLTPTRTLTKAEHDALLGDAPKTVSREDYERMMREAQE